MSITIRISSVPDKQGPAPSGSSVVAVNVKPPAPISATVGVYSIFSVLMFGVYTPLPPDQVIVVAVPPIADVMDTVASSQLPEEGSIIFTVAALLKLKVI